MADSHSDIFLKIEGVEGESTDDKHKNEIEVLAYSWGASNPVGHISGQGLGAGKVTFQDINFTVQYSKASPKLFLACATGEHLKKATLTHRKAGGDQVTFLEYVLTELLVTSYQTGASGGDSVPTESFSMAFVKVEIDYGGQKADGTAGGPVKVGYNLATNKKV
jgi:type VI secretion system secreted protein Hcp